MKISIIIKIIVGFLALILGLIGLFLPVWPTTPFVLFSVGCFSSTPKMQKKILKIPVVREYYEGYKKKSGISRRTVVGSLLFLWSMLIISMLLVENLIVVIFLMLVGLSVTIHILWISKPKSIISEGGKS